VSETPSIKDRTRTAIMIAEQNLLIDRSAYERIVSRRETLIDKLRFGVFGLNAGSLLALIGALGGKGEAALWLGFDRQTAFTSAVAFALGMISASAAIVVESNKITVEAGDAFARASAAGRICAMHEMAATPEAYAKLGDELDAYAAMPLVGFRYHRLPLWLQCASQGLWLFGLALPILKAAGV